MSYVKLIGAAIIPVSLYLCYQYVINIQHENTVLRQDITNLKTSNEILSKEKQQFKDNLQKTKQSLKQVNMDFKKSEEQKNRMVKLFSDHNLQNLMEKKPGLISKRMQKATDKIFKEFEDESEK